MDARLGSRDPASNVSAVGKACTQHNPSVTCLVCSPLHGSGFKERATCVLCHRGIGLTILGRNGQSPWTIHCASLLTPRCLNLGNGTLWQMVMNLGKSRLGGVGLGGLLEGEPRSSLQAWNTYQQWILSGAQQGWTHIYPETSTPRLYSFEWAVAFDPCVSPAPGIYYNGSWPDTRVHINIALGDVDWPVNGTGNFAEVSTLLVVRLSSCHHESFPDI